MADLFRDYMMDPFGQSRFFGVYKGFVVGTEDPKAKHRLRVSIPALFGNDHAEWAEAVLPPINATNLVIPSINDQVWVMFEGGNPDFPVWIGVR